ncbi:MAG: fasciclin domain-containing protein [Phycisphaerales bacterium]|nr:fasciclin domain-containing protein [Phycisphaerales bacterium]
MTRTTLNAFRPANTRRLLAITAAAGLSLALISAALGVGRAAPRTTPAAAATVEPTANILSVARGAGSFKTLAAAIEAAGLTSALNADGPFTVFAPTDAAFAKLPASTLAALLKPENKDALTAILTYHVIAARVTSVQAAGLSTATTLNTAELPISLRDGRLTVQNAAVIKTDIAATNGVIHVIDSVLLPPNLDLSRLTATRSQAAAPMSLIQAAIDRGVPMYNDHQPKACTKIYEVAMVGLMAMDDTMVPTNVKASLERAMDRARAEHSWSKKAWAYREGLDQAAEMLATTSAADMASSTQKTPTMPTAR